MKARCIAALLVLVLISSLVSAECKKYGVVNPVWDLTKDQDSPHGSISAFLEHTFLPTENKGAKWLLMDFGGSFIPLAGEPVYPAIHGSGGAPDYYETVILKPEADPLLNHEYALYVTNFKFDDCKSLQTVVTSASVQTKRPKSQIAEYSPSTTRDDSDFYLAPTVDGASGTTASYTADVKLQFRVAIVAPLFGVIQPQNAPTRYVYRPGVNFVPGIDLKASSNPKEDGNSVLFNLPFEIVAPTSSDRFQSLSRLLPAIISKPSFVAEADKKFHDINSIFSNSEYFVMRGFGETVQFVPEPFIGVETGSNLKAQAAKTYPNGILRATFGMHVGFLIFAKSKTKPLFTIESDYVRRLLLEAEPVFTQDSKGNLVLASVGTQPRDHVTNKLSYDLTSYVALSIGHEYGELPPVYTKVDNKYTFGIVFKGQLLKPPTAPK